MPMIKSGHEAERMFGEQFEAMVHAEHSVAHRGDAYKLFTEAGLPGRRIESWHYTDLRGLVREALPPAAEPDAAAVAVAKERLKAHEVPGAARFVLLDGTYRPDLSDLAALPAGVTVRPVLDALYTEELDPGLAGAQKLGQPESMLALNSAFLQGGVMIDVAPGTKVEGPIELVLMLSGRAPAATYDRSYIRVGDGASVTLIERHAAFGEAKSLAATVLVASVGDGASFEHLARVDGLGPQALHLGTALVRIGADAQYRATTLVATPGVTRRQAYVEFVGERSSSHLYGVSLLDGRSHADTTLIVTHTAPHCESRELFKHILAGEATGIYQGRVVVAPGAQKTDGKMLSKCIFLGDGANMYNKPELEIFADDVVCGHGATVGALDDDQLFYLRARGIPLREAQAMLLEAFADEAVEAVTVDSVKDEMVARVGDWLRQHGR
ncbi:Fe-S cluster assembly protein SufD [Lichenibacterium dinghuense]|uniref:Fe-S cluster assembly protein SufD n=1 Tax=Lichenibacterium dinghuense TaxID=2895977 RepID=UPI001F030942|nr:Fe-S cluster assembly protein SufD [Lichenibacterium sp. 6Y81]